MVLLLGFEHAIINLDSQFGALLGGIRYHVGLAFEACGKGCWKLTSLKLTGSILGALPATCPN
jgi:hypothetical protein